LDPLLPTLLQHAAGHVRRTSASPAEMGVAA